MKTYTDLEQSKKLAEILPIESADMFFCNDGSVKLMHEHLKDIPVTTPCLSLAALVDVLPRIDIEKEIWSSKKYDYRVKAYIGDGYVGDWYNNPVDATVNMILTLKEKNLL